MSWDGRQHKQRVAGYELVEGRRGPHDQIVWKMLLPCGHVAELASGRPARPGEYGAVNIDGTLYVGVAKAIACRDKSCPSRSIRGGLLS